MTCCFIEYMTLRTWLFSALPRLIGDDHKGLFAYIDSTRVGRWTAGITGKLFGITTTPLAFRLLDLKDEDGLLLRLRIATQDLQEIQRDILRSTEFNEAADPTTLSDFESAYIAKRLVSTDLTGRETLWRSLLLIQLAHLKAPRERSVLFLEQRPWMESIRRYAARFHVDIIAAPRSRTRKDYQRFIISWIPDLWVDLLNLQRHGVRDWRRWAHTIFPRAGRRPSQQKSSAKLAVDYYGQLNLDKPEQNSDLFFWQQSKLSGKDLLVLFGLPHDPLDDAKLQQLAAYQMNAAAVRPEACVSVNAPVYRATRARASRTFGTQEVSWVNQQKSEYQALRSHWSRVFDAENVMLYTSWFRYDATHCAISDALRQRGGISTFYQRAFDTHSTPEIAATADVFFGYAPRGAEIEQASGSRLRYYVATGFFGDHRFPLLRPQAKSLREKLQRQGAQHIIAFTDEGSADDSRWHTGHDLPRESYAFLCEKVLSEPWLGLVIKPKAPTSLRKRLGPVAELLKRAEATGRCVVIEGGKLHGAFPPAAAALAADVAIHGHLCAGTAAMEMALAGVPTLAMDREGWAASPLYRLGVGRVVFKDWPTLWETCRQQWSASTPIAGFGDWSSILDTLDPFRDGRAAERMGTYLQWLLEGFSARLDRDAIMAQAAERYADQWGADKVIELNPDRQSSLPSKPTLNPHAVAGGRG